MLDRLVMTKPMLWAGEHLAKLRQRQINNTLRAIGMYDQPK